MTLTESQVTDLAQPIASMLESISKFYENPINRNKYREWHLKKFGCKPGEITK